MPPKQYEITQVGTFNNDIERIKRHVPRLMEFIKGAEEVLARDPGKGDRTIQKVLWSMSMAQLEDQPKVTLYYIPTKDVVVFVFLRLEGDPKPPKLIL